MRKRVTIYKKQLTLPGNVSVKKNKEMKTHSLKILLLLTLGLSTNWLHAQEYVTENQFETMIRLGAISDENPIYQMPAGKAGSAYIVSAITSGDAVKRPLNYLVNSAPDRHYVIVSKTTTLVEKGHSFKLTIKEDNTSPKQIITVYTDWDRDGIFQKEAQPLFSSENKETTQTLTVPTDAKPGKTRIRVRLDSSVPADANAEVDGRIYDFIVYTIKNK